MLMGSTLRYARFNTILQVDSLRKVTNVNLPLWTTPVAVCVKKWRNNSVASKLPTHNLRQAEFVATIVAWILAPLSIEYFLVQSH